MSAVKLNYKREREGEKTNLAVLLGVLFALGCRFVRLLWCRRRSSLLRRLTSLWRRRWRRHGISFLRCWGCLCCWRLRNHGLSLWSLRSLWCLPVPAGHPSVWSLLHSLVHLRIECSLVRCRWSHTVRPNHAIRLHVKGPVHIRRHLTGTKVHRGR